MSDNTPADPTPEWLARQQAEINDRPRGLSTDDGEGDDARTAKRSRKPRGPKPVTAERIHNKALWYLERWATSRANLKRSLMTWAYKSVQAHGSSLDEAERLIDAELDRLEEVHLLDDKAYAEGRAASLHRAGQSTRMIQMKLREKGLSDELVGHALAALQDETPGDPERAAALTLARKRRLGPWQNDPEKRAARRDKDLAALARAGFSFDLALEIVDAETVEALEQDSLPDPDLPVALLDDPDA
jgi:regulatory protein